MACLRVANMIDSPSAAAYYFTHSLEFSVNENVLVCELTNSSFEVSLVKCNAVRVCSCGFYVTDDMGFDDITMSIYNLVEESYKSEHGHELFSGVSDRVQHKMKDRLFRECENALLRLLGGYSENPIEVDEDCEYPIRKELLGRTCEISNQKMESIIDKCIERSKATRQDVKKVVWVCWMGYPEPMKRKLEEMFGIVSLRESVYYDPRSEVTIGAMRYAMFELHMSGVPFLDPSMMQ